MGHVHPRSLWRMMATTPNASLMSILFTPSTSTTHCSRELCHHCKVFFSVLTRMPGIYPPILLPCLATIAKSCLGSSRHTSSSRHV
ncbi:uncharacterized protein K460DRAFT_165736 [Cucurbitaria berberidis CBS 394.84]|uniref:Uncharacterized protein n=1 Tax=Cucurbitaria berberidis CBS 394.84 TaxID=1168544 RepID=A0A9P4L4I5_9PLEO|nr:uncharacterized protein K460DRAFT_165736 [Cucurbitaria berberidis CBS 394.84]KAF1841354.1 hypothetical protein K460DRAFT_165736 [Cucurbitaria berberidis CBS 394.84]